MARHNRNTSDFFYVSDSVGYVNLLHVAHLFRTHNGGRITFRNGKEEQLTPQEFALISNRIREITGAVHG